jgi:hypothetical protein
MSHRRRKLSDRVQTVIDEVLHALRTDGIDASSAPPECTVQLSRLEERVLMSASPVMVLAEAAGVTAESANSASDSSATGILVSHDEAFSTNDDHVSDASIEGDWDQRYLTNGSDHEELLDDSDFDEILTNNETSTTPMEDLLDQLQSFSSLLDENVSPDDELTMQVSAGIEDSLLLPGSSNTAGSFNPVPESPMDLIEQVLGDNATTERSTLLSGPELVVIDYRVHDADVLLAELLADNHDVRLLRLSADEDGLLQISEKLQSLGTVSAIHLLTHGRDGEILLGSTRLNAESLNSHAGTLTSWSEHLTNDADVMIYGCDVASTVAGQSFVASLHSLTNADIAASNDTTGGSSLGGDWDLEYVTGNVATAPLFSPRVLGSWQHQLPAGLTIIVTTTADVVDATDLSSVSALLATPGADGQISLREALIAANANADIDEIVLGTGIYRISIAGNDNSADKGDFDVSESVIIRGAGSGMTRIDANSIDRIFDVRGTSILDVSDVTITGGYAESDARSGGAVRISRDANAVMTRVVVSDNAAKDDGGGIANDGTLTLVDVSITNNVATRDGGGLHNSGTATLDRVTLSGNTAATGGAIEQQGPGTSILVTNSTISGNTASASGGGLSLAGPATLRNATIAFNTANTNGAGLHVVSGTTSVQNTLFASNLLTNGTSTNSSGSINSLGNNLSSDSSSVLNQPSDMRNTDPQLEALADNGGATQTHALKQSSAAIDAATTVSASTTDQRSVSRDGAVDIGAYEYNRAFPATSEFQVNTTIDDEQVTSTNTTFDGSGNSDTATVHVTITGVNHAPVLAATAVNLGAIVANENSPAIAVTDLIASATDVDHGANSGVAITATTGTGTWGYSIDGITWTNIGTVSASQALLLDSTAQLRFNGTGLSAGTASVTFHAWDQTGTSAGLANTKFNTATEGTGGSTSLSASAATATLTLNAFNFPPTGVADSYQTAEDTPLVTNSAAGWFNSAWNTRQRITLNNASGAALTNQVVLITLEGSTIDYAKTQNAGQDLRFVDSDGTLLNYEIEEWNESGTSRVWVRVPQIDAGSNTDHLWLYYGNAQASDAQNSAAVWLGQELVLHMDGTVADSSANALGVVSNSTTATSGISSGARSFDGVNGSVKVNSSSQVDDLFLGGGTISAWINPTGWGENGYGRIADKASSTFAGGLLGNGWALQVASDGSLIFEQGYTVRIGQWKTAPGAIDLNEWQHVTTTFDSLNSGTPPRFYVNGVAFGTTTVRYPVGLLLLDSAEQLTIGNHAVSDIRTFNGRIDEFRASSSTLSAAQVLADYRSMAGTLTSIGAAEAGPGGVLTNDTDPEQQPLTATLASGPSHAASFSLNPDGSFTYVPVANYFGTDSFTYSVSDGEKSDGPITVSIVVAAVNDVPDSVNLSKTSFASSSTGAVVGTLNVSDVDAGDTHTLSVSDARFEIVGSILRLKADQSVNGFIEPTVTLIISAMDSEGAIRNQTLTLSVITINMVPLAAIGGPYTIAEGDSLTVSAAGSSDPENQTLTFAWDLDGDGTYDDATGQTATLSSSELQAFSTPVNDDGTRTISVIVTDTGGLSATVSTTLTVTNAAPVVTVTGPSTATSGVPITLNLSKSDPGNDTITIWRINWGDGQIENVAGALNSASHTYQTPGGTRSIQVEAIDEDGTFPMSGGPLVVTVANTAPSNLALSSTTLDGNTPAAVVGTLKFSDPDFGDAHNIVVSDTRFVVVAGILRLADGQSINPAVESTVNLSVTVTDITGSSTAATFTLNVNTLPTAVADNYKVDGTRRFRVTSRSVGVLANDIDPDGPLRKAVLVSGPSHNQSFGLNADGTFWYQSHSGYSGTDSFSYRLFDGRVYSAPVVVTLTVNQPAELSFNPAVFSIDENTTLTTALRIGQFIIDDDGIGTNTLTLAGASAVHFQLDAQNNLYLKQGRVFDHEATQKLTVIGRVDDRGISRSPDDTRTVVVSVRDRNDAPVATSLGTTRLAEDFGNATINVGTAFSDQDGDVLNFQFTVVSQTSDLFSTREFNSATGVISLSSNPDRFGLAVIDVTATDASGAVAVSRIRIRVDAVNDAPEAFGFNGTTLAGQMMHGASLLTGIVDVENDLLSVVMISTPANGMITVNADGTFLYIPNTGFFGTETFEFAASDGTSVGVTRVGTILVQPPVINGGSGSSSGDSSSSTSSGSGSSSTIATNTNTDTSTKSSNTNTDTSTKSSNTNTNTNTNTGSGKPSVTTLAPEPVKGTTSGELQNNLDIVDDSPDDDQIGFIRQFLSTTGVDVQSDGRSNSLQVTTDHESARRKSGKSQLTFVTDTAFGLISANGPYSHVQQREMLYQTLIAQHIQSVNELEKDMGRTFSMTDRVVGSVEVVTTVSSVGYLIWNAGRGGILLSSLMAQIPAWNMLDPLLVIDGDSKDEDKESLQNIMDQQQKKLKRENAGKTFLRNAGLRSTP